MASAGCGLRESMNQTINSETKSNPEVMEISEWKAEHCLACICDYAQCNDEQSDHGYGHLRHSVGFGKPASNFGIDGL
jgi:hypothetical protein